MNESMAEERRGQPNNRDVIVVGASAGGVEAVRRLIGMLPADLPASCSS